VLHQKGLPSLTGMGDNLVPLEEYQLRLHSIAVDKSIFSKIKGTITEKTFIEDLSFDLLIEHEIKQSNPPFINILKWMKLIEH